MSLTWDIEAAVKEKKFPAIFLDRDGVIIKEKNFQSDPATIEFIPGSLEALSNLGPNFLTVVISNQSGIARGYFSQDDVIKFHHALDKILRQQGIAISAWYFCPHGPDDDCSCRKPRPGMVLRAAQDLAIDIDASWIVGDKSSDIATGNASGLRTILVMTGYAGQEPGARIVRPDHTANNLLAAVDFINGKAGSNL
jgi:D-glycero-D-manno-heptose 1,7-bisphosphate phosphatase